MAKFTRYGKNFKFVPYFDANGVQQLSRVDFVDPKPYPKKMDDRSKYNPHQGEKEKARRVTPGTAAHSSALWKED